MTVCLFGCVIGFPLNSAYQKRSSDTKLGMVKFAMSGMQLHEGRSHLEKTLANLPSGNMRITTNQRSKSNTLNETY